MNSKERLQAVLSGENPDCVPVAPDVSNMIPAKQTGKPFWELYLYNNPPIWKAYIDCVKYFGFDALMDGYIPVNLDDEQNTNTQTCIVAHTTDRIITQRHLKTGWEPTVTVYYRDNPPTSGLDPEKIGLPRKPREWEPVEGVREWPEGEDLIRYAKEEMGDHGLVGVSCGTTKLLSSPEDIYDYYDNPGKYEEKRDHLLTHYVQRFEKLIRLDCKPDFICTGASGTLIHQTPEIFCRLGLPILKKITALAKQEDIPTHLHSCGPQRELVKIAAEETDLTVIDPLEPPPMGDCDLAELKHLYGNDLVLKGNLHTTRVMLRGSVDDVIQASKAAIDAAAEGGGFILSTGDQCSRDTPEENIWAMIDTARTYGRY